MNNNIYYKMPKVEEEQKEYDSGYPYTFDGKQYIVIQSIGKQTVIFVPEELYPDEK